MKIHLVELLKITKSSYWFRYLFSKLMKHHYVDLSDRKINGQVKKIVWNQYAICSNQLSPLDYPETIILADHILHSEYTVFSDKCQQFTGNGWKTDFITGYRWNDVHSISWRETPDKNDIKYPWELSRLHMLLTLAQAAFLTNECKYLIEYKSLIRDWVINNPVGIGVNWACPMEVSIRALNIFVSALYIREIAHDVLFMNEIENCLYSHLLYLRGHIEYGIVRGNHYLADIVGLLVLSRAFNGDSKAKKIYKFALRRFREEILYQVFPDGVDHEGSTAYHALVMELISVGILFGCDHINDIGVKAKERYDRMSHFMYDLCSFAEYPFIGDNDSGRVFWINKMYHDQYSDILGLHAVLMSKKAPPHLPLSYALWLSGSAPEKEKDHEFCETRRDYPYGGFYFLKNESFRLLLRGGTVGLRGKGGHGHNDQLSLYIDVGGDPFLTDPGTYVYTRDRYERNEFRKTANHNVAWPGEAEQNEIYFSKPFSMEERTRTSIDVVIRGLENVIYYGAHNGYKYLGADYARTICVSRGKIEISDKIAGKYKGDISIGFVVHPSVTSTLISKNVVEFITRSGIHIRMQSLKSESITVENTFISRIYGTKSPTKKVVAHFTKDENIGIYQTTVEIANHVS